MERSRLVILVVAMAALICGCKEDTGRQVNKEKETSMSSTLQWLGHASFRIEHNGTVIYIDPWKLKEARHDATAVLVSHSHYDHYSADDIAKVSNAPTKLIASADVIREQGQGEAIGAGQTIELDGASVTGVASYNPNKPFHPKANGWLGFVIEIDSTRIYYAGDTDMTEEMKALTDIDLALLPVGGNYTMDSKEAAEAVGYFKPKRAVPYHWGDIVGSQSDANGFAEKAQCEVTVLKPGETFDLMTAR